MLNVSKFPANPTLCMWSTPRTPIGNEIFYLMNLNLSTEARLAVESILKILGNDRSRLMCCFKHQRPLPDLPFLLQSSETNILSHQSTKTLILVHRDIHIIKEPSCLSSGVKHSSLHFDIWAAYRTQACAIPDDTKISVCLRLSTEYHFRKPSLLEWALSITVSYPGGPEAALLLPFWRADPPSAGCAGPSRGAIKFYANILA